MKIGLYWILFLGQTIGGATILSHIIPLSRRLVTSGLYEKAPPKILVFGALGATIIQVCYWLDQYWFATLRLRYNALLGHIILFLSRLNFHIRFSRVFRSLHSGFQGTRNLDLEIRTHKAQCTERISPLSRYPNCGGNFVLVVPLTWAPRNRPRTRLPTDLGSLVSA